MGWRGCTIGVSVIDALFVIPQQDWMKAAYERGDEAFLGGLIFGPILTGLLVWFVVIGIDFLQDPIEQRKLIAAAAANPQGMLRDAIQNAALLVFIAGMVLSAFGQAWVTETWWFWLAFVVGVGLSFLPKRN